MAQAGIVLYYSSVPSSVAVEKNGDRAKFLLEAARVPFTLVDLASNEVAREHMQLNSGLENKKTIPQVFVDGKFKADINALEEANEDGELVSFLSS